MARCESERKAERGGKSAEERERRQGGKAAEAAQGMFISGERYVGSVS